MKLQVHLLHRSSAPTTTIQKREKKKYTQQQKTTAERKTKEKKTVQVNWHSITIDLCGRTSFQEYS